MIFNSIINKFSLKLLPNFQQNYYQLFYKTITKFPTKLLPIFTKSVTKFSSKLILNLNFSTKVRKSLEFLLSLFAFSCCASLSWFK